MKLEKLKLPSGLIPYSGIIYFMVILIVSHFLWKFTVLGDESDTIVTFFGLDISAPFSLMADHVAKMVKNILTMFGYVIMGETGNILRHENGNAVRIVWACTGIKQAYIFFCIIAFYRGPFKTKLWYIPLGIAVTYLFNIFRISVITGIVYNHFNLFELVHEHIFKYLFYGLIFGMWVLWEEKISRPRKKESE
jgi:exosortase/archaeosortase family protein